MTKIILIFIFISLVFTEDNATNNNSNSTPLVES